jgi:hypothetical protein
MRTLFLMLLVLCGTAQVATGNASTGVYFNNDIGIVFEADQADIKFGMTLNAVRQAMKQTAKLTSGKGERSLMFDFACNSDDCTIDDGGLVVFNFVNNVLVGIMLSANNDVTAEKYSSLVLKFYGEGCDYKCTRRENGVEMNGFGWKGKIKTTATIIDMGGGRGLAITEFRTDKFRFNVRKSVCTPN